nr:ClassD_beta_lactamase [uncultured bacterium]
MKKHFLRFTWCLFCFILFSSCAPAQNTPPKEENKREADLLELVKLDKTIKLDIRYARTDNFVGKVVYPEARAFLQRPAAEAVVRVNQKLKEKGLGLMIFDGYRPWAITKLFWEVTPDDKRKFVANPANGSKHNRGCAVDLSIYDLQTGKLVEMPSDFDEFTERASPDYMGGTEKERANRDLLRKSMEAEGFTVNANEWWHFDYKDWQSYAIYDIPFSAIGDLKTRFSEAKIEEHSDWKRFFDAAKAKGGIVIYDLRENKYMVYDRERMNRGFVPASTSKIIHSLIFLDSGAVKDENEIIKWDGVKRWVPEWNQDHSLKTALKASAAWFYVEASKRAGRETMQKYYDAAGYGNRSTEGFGEDYWVKGKLRITPRQQIEFLVKFYENRLPFSPKVPALVKDLLVYEKTDKYIIRGKTGWSQDFDPWVGWWIGYVERGSDIYFFATELDMKKNEDAQKRYEITKRVLRSLKVIE